MSSLPARWVRGAALAAVGAVMTCSLSGCGYALTGKGNTLPTWIQIIGVPPIVNLSTVADVDVVLTDAVRAEFQSRGRYRVVPESEGTDALFTATVTSVRLTPISFINNRQASRYSATVTAQVTFKDKTGKVYVSNRVVQFTEEYDVSTSTDPHDATAFFGQNVNALQRLAKNFAQSVVTSILEAF